MDEWTKILEKGGKIDSVYMDFMNAFDKVPHRRLLHKMHRYKISEKVIKWVERFLSNRIQKVIVNGTESKCHHVTSGIPQGSVLGPMLFVIYINDMPEMVESSTYLFADDTKIFREIREENDEKMLQADLNSLQSWSDTWLLKFHPNKCKVMSVANKSVDNGTNTIIYIITMAIELS
jgi:retron-type reverse transcriptase